MLTSPFAPSPTGLGVWGGGGGGSLGEVGGVTSAPNHLSLVAKRCLAAVSLLQPPCCARSPMRVRIVAKRNQK